MDRPSTTRQHSTGRLFTWRAMPMIPMKFAIPFLERASLEGLRRGDIIDQRGSAWKWTEPSHTFSASDVLSRQANVVCDPPERRELSCATEELRQHLVLLVEKGTFSRWPPISGRDFDPSFRLPRGWRAEVLWAHAKGK
jgi:hypothetical protein